MSNSKFTLDDFKAMPNHQKALHIYEEGSLISTRKHQNYMFYLFWLETFFVEVIHDITYHKIFSGTAFISTYRLIHYCDFDLKPHLPENILAGYWDNAF